MIAMNWKTDRPAWLPTLRHAKRLGQTIVAVNGCFDLLHRGHVGVLKAAALRPVGSREGVRRVIVLVNSDDSVARLKGTLRPYQPVEDRVAVLAALKYVDDVLVFHEDTPSDALQLIRPHLLYKGAEYEYPGAVAGAEFCGQVKFVGMEPDCSTTHIANRIRTNQ